MARLVCADRRLIMLHNQTLKKKLLKGGAWAFAGKLTAAVSALLINMFLARVLSPDELGVYFLAFSFVTVVSIIAQLGLGQVVLRYVAESVGIGSPSRAVSAIVCCAQLFFKNFSIKFIIATREYYFLAFVFLYELSCFVKIARFN